jgi:hypothetical protein
LWYRKQQEQQQQQQQQQQQKRWHKTESGPSKTGSVGAEQFQGKNPANRSTDNINASQARLPC